MLFEIREPPPAVAPLSIQCWNRRQRKQHQYTPALPIQQRNQDLVRLTFPSSSSSRFKSGRELQNYTTTTTGVASLHQQQQFASSSSSSLTGALPFEPAVNSNTPDFLPKSHRILKWEKQHHTVQLSTFADKISGAPSPQQREALEAMFRESLRGGQRRLVSQAEMRRQILGHQVAL